MSNTNGFRGLNVRFTAVKCEIYCGFCFVKTLYFLFCEIALTPPHLGDIVWSLVFGRYSRGIA